jgi:ABC-2 type transport system permease protein
MFAEFKHTLRRLRGQIIGWSIGLLLYGLLMTSLYGSMIETMDVTEFLQNYPQQMIDFFGMVDGMGTPKGYLDTFYLGYLPVVVGIFSIGVGASLLVGHEEKGILDLILAHPITRPGLFWGRLLGLTGATVAILLACWLSWLVPTGGPGLGLSGIELLRPFVPVFAVLMLFGSLALLLSFVLPSARMAAMLAGALLVGNYLLMGMANMSEALQPLVRLTPLYYFQGGDAIAGLNWGWLAGLLGVSLIFAVAGWALFQRRDIRVGGERSWRLPWVSRLLKRGETNA